MRIIGGALRGQRLKAKPPPDTRPTSDRVREGLASALDARRLFEGARALDLFAGTGALGFEALSRGAASLVALDASRAAVRTIAENARGLGLSERVRVLELDLFGAFPKLQARLEPLAPFELVFVDPPYARAADAAEIVAQLASHGLFAPGAVIAFEHARRDPPAWPAGFEVLASYAYGDTGVALLRSIAASAET